MLEPNSPPGRLGTLLIVYHRPFWRAADGSLWEREGAFSRYVESLAPHFERILLAVPEMPAPRGSDSAPGHRLAAPNVALAPLPFFDGIPNFVKVVPAAGAALWRTLGLADLVNLRLPTPAGSLAYGLARLRGRPTFLLVVGDLAGVAASVPADSLRRRLYHGYVWFEERLLQAMVEQTLTITNGDALRSKHARPGRPIFATRNSTIRREDVGRARQSLAAPRVRLLCVSRIDPRKGLRFLPAALAVLRERGLEPSLDLLGPPVGRLGEQERQATLTAARELGLADMVHFHGAASIEQVASAYTEHDVLVVPSLPGEGIPRVLLEAMAAGLPVVATRVAGIPDLIHDGENGLLVPPADGKALGLAVARQVVDPDLRAACVAGGYATARQHTADGQAAWIAELLERRLLQPSKPTQGPIPASVGADLGVRPGARPTIPSGAWRAPGTDEGGHVGPTLPTKRAMRITIPLAGLNLSGGVKSLLLLANRLVERGTLVRVLAPDYAPNPPVVLDPRVDLRVLRTCGPRVLRKLDYLAQLARRSAAGTDLVLANFYLTAYPAVVSWLLHGRRAALAYNIRGYEPWSHGLMAPAGRASRYLRFALAWLTYRLPLTRLVTTDWLASMVGDRQAIVVGHGIDLEVFQPNRREPKARLTVGVIARLGAVKGYPDFLAAIELLPVDLPLNILVVRGDVVPLPNRDAVASLEARSETEMAAFYRRCDIFVFPSLAEGFGLPALEALASGCALVTTECGGVAAFARSGENCLMVAPGRPAELAAAIERLVRDPGLRRRLVKSGLVTAAGFSRMAALDRLVDALLPLVRR
jgi:glycosyltransferase involved in cell wall biosynthesis